MDIKKNAFLILLMILLLGAFLRVWGIGNESYWLDEAISIRQAQEKDYSATLDMVTNDIHLPLHIILLHYWVKIFGTSEISSRSLSSVFGVIGIWICYLLARRLYDERTALLSSLIFAISPVMIYYSQEARLYTLFVLLSLLSFLFYLRFIEDDSNKNLFYYGLFSLLLIYTHLFAFLVLLVQNIHILHRFNLQIRRLSRWFISQLLLFVMFLPWINNLLKQVSSTLNTMWIPKPNIGIILKSIIDLIGNGYILIIILFCIICLFLAEKRKLPSTDKHFFIFLWFVLPFVIVVSYSYLVSPVYHTRYMLFTIPAFFVIFALMIVRISEKNRLLSYAIIGSIVILSFISITGQAKNLEKDDWRSVSLFISENAREDEYVFINPFYHHDPFTYYFDSSCFKDYYIHSCNYDNHNLLALRWDAVCCNNSTQLTATDEKNRLKDYTNETVWLVSVREKLYEANLFDYFDDNMDLVMSKEHGEIKIYKFKNK